MRRLVVELDVEETAKYLEDVALDKLERMEVLRFLEEGPDEFALVCRVRLKDPSTKLSAVIKDPTTDVRVLSREKDGSFIVFMKTKQSGKNDGSDALKRVGGYFTTPYEIRDGKVKVTFLGQPKEIRSFLKTIDKIGARYRVDLLTDAKFAPDSPISRLTDKQREALITAYNLGYYDIPRKIDTNELAQKLKIRNPTFVMHRRKAEKAILKELLSEV